jgi:localization factor PodJL
MTEPATEQSEKSAQATRDLLLETARELVLRGDNKFSIATLCAAAGVEPAVFRTHFAGKTALMAALMHARPASAQAATTPATPAPAEPTAAPAPAPVSKAGVTPESSVSTPDAWLERRLRVFERALNALETNAEAAARQQARTITQLEERLAALASPAGTAVPAIAQPVTVAPRMVETPAPQLAAVEAPATEQADAPAPETEKKPAPELLAIVPQQAQPFSKQEMAEVLQSAREAAARAAEPPATEPDRIARKRWLAIGALSLVALLLCIGLSLGKGALGSSAAAQESDGVAHRHAAGGGIARTIALADAGDARAQAKLALAYLRGDGVASDPAIALRWSSVAAHNGQPVAQYLLGALYQQGDHVKADPHQAFAWFSAAADKGNLKAMHNLGIAYAQGLGTMKDDARAVEWFTRAAERGCVDSAFDLAVLYERGEGVPQDLRQALKWYSIAGQAGDAPSKERAEVLRGQLGPVEAKLAANAATSFAPLPALSEANSL